MKLPHILSAALLAAAPVAAAGYDRPASLIWSERCAGCHGRDGKGTPEGLKLHVPDLTQAETQKKFTDVAAVRAIMAGRKQDLHFLEPAVSIEEAYQLVQYVRNFQGPESPRN
jgi:mono/diheme cytochrome c family protein